MKIAIIGSGYVGLVSGVCLASVGHEVICVDINENIVNCLNESKPHIYELGLTTILEEVRFSNRFKATTDLNMALDQVEIAIIAVGTPSKNGVIDLGYIRKISKQIGEYIKINNRHISIVVKSTVIPGTTDTVVREEIEKSSGKRFPAFGLGMNPEFLREGEAIEDFSNPDRIVLGYEDDKTLDRLQELYSHWNVEKVCVNTRTAEMIKYASNCLLATQISAINEMANLSAAVGGIDILDVVNGVHLDKRWSPTLPNGSRVSPKILTYHIPGCGFGGSCFPKDVQALRSLGGNYGLTMSLLDAVLRVNDNQPFEVVNIIERELLSLAQKKILVLGLAFKPGTDDVRESATGKIINGLVQKRAEVIAHDPIAIDNFKACMDDNLVNHVCFVEKWIDYVEKCDVILIATNWPEYFRLNELNLKGKIIFDSRRMFKSIELEGSTYLSIGMR